jgi:hypothetical protein
MGFFGRLFGREEEEDEEEQVKVEKPVRYINRGARNFFNNRGLTKTTKLKEPSVFSFQSSWNKYNNQQNKRQREQNWGSIRGKEESEILKLIKGIKYSWDKVLSERDFQILLSRKKVINGWRLTTLDPNDWELNDLNPNKDKFKLSIGSKIYRQILETKKNSNEELSEQEEYEIVKRLREKLKNPLISQEDYNKLLHYDSINTVQWDKYTDTERGETMYERSIKQNVSLLKEGDTRCWKSSGGMYLGKFEGTTRETQCNYQSQGRYPGTAYTSYSFDKGSTTKDDVFSTRCKVQAQTGGRKSRRSKGRKMRRTRRRCAFA